MTDPSDLHALRQLARTQVKLRRLLSKHAGDKLPAELVAGLVDLVMEIDTVLLAAQRGVPRA